MKTTLEELKLYKNENVVNRFLETWEMSFEEAEDIFGETMKWLWLIAYNKECEEKSIEIAISQSTKLIDEMWHTFILFTKDYFNFCEQYFGYYLHHYPTPKSHYDQTILQYERAPEVVIEKNRQLFDAQYELIYDTLGEETLVKWYSDYLEKYTDEFMEKIWQWSFSPYDSRVKARVKLTPNLNSLS
jgi:hypothetical protein